MIGLLRILIRHLFIKSRILVQEQITDLCPHLHPVMYVLQQQVRISCGIGISKLDWKAIMYDA